MNLLLGTHFHGGSADALRRQRHALDASTRLSGAEVINLQWPDDVLEHPGIMTVRGLRQDSQSVTGLKGIRKPIVADVFDQLARAATARGCRYFAFFNSDVIVTPAAVATIVEGNKETYAFSRMDVYANGVEQSIRTSGLDLFAFDTAWWREHRRRFRPYIIGEPCFDNVCAAVMMCHGKGVILNRHGEIRHEMHDAERPSTFDSHNVYLTTLDAPYFSLWVAYWQQLMAARERQASEEEEIDLQRRLFVLRQSFAARLHHAARCLKAHWRFRARRAGPFQQPIDLPSRS